jgi:hypothetical protein
MTFDPDPLFGKSCKVIMLANILQLLLLVAVVSAKLQVHSINEFDGNTCFAILTYQLTETPAQ